jgi:hypothetical protein
MFESMTLKDYHFTDDQIDTILRVMRDKAFQVKYVRGHEDFFKNSKQLDELANLIEDQIANHPEND